MVVIASEEATFFKRTIKSNVENDDFFDCHVEEVDHSYLAYFYNIYMQLTVFLFSFLSNLLYCLFLD